MFNLGQKVKLVQGEQNYYGKNRHSDHGEWIAGKIPVGSTGTIALVKDKYPEFRGDENGPHCIIWDHNPTPKKGYYWAITLDYKYSGIVPLDAQ